MLSDCYQKQLELGLFPQLWLKHNVINDDGETLGISFTHDGDLLTVLKRDTVRVLHHDEVYALGTQNYHRRVPSSWSISYRLRAICDEGFDLREVRLAWSLWLLQGWSVARGRSRWR